MSDTKIEWTDKTWNPVTGCTPVSPGCAHCYARRMAKRLAGRYGYPESPHEFDVTLHTEKLDEPLRWRKPARVFVCSMSDLFHEDVPFAFIERIFAVMEVCVSHTFQVLTKRPDRVREFFTQYGYYYGDEKPLPNIWIGITAENQEQFYARYYWLAQIPAAVRFVSLEPLLGPIEMGSATPDWVIVGGETGPGARPMNSNWIHSLKNQCLEAGVPFFFKSWGDWIPLSEFAEFDYTLPPDQQNILYRSEMVYPDGKLHVEGMGREHADEVGLPELVYLVGKKKSGRLLDGREWNEYPKD